MDATSAASDETSLTGGVSVSLMHGANNGNPVFEEQDEC